MAEYIEREALIAFLNEDMVFCKHALDESPFSKGVQTGLNAGINYATVLAAADVVERNAFNRLMERYKKATGRMPNGVMRQMVEVVRCKDCKHCLQTSMHCVRPTAANKYPKMKADDFCSYGERRADNCGADMREANDAN